MTKTFTSIFMDEHGNYDFTFADEDDLRYISENPDGFLADDYQAAAQAELDRRQHAAVVTGCLACGFSFRSTSTASLEKGECANCGADWPLHGKREQAQAPQHTPSPELLRALDTLLSRDAEPTPTAISAMIHRANEQHASTIADLLTENASLRSLLAAHVGLLRGQAEIARTQGYYVAAIALEKAADEAAKEAVDG